MREDFLHFCWKYRKLSPTPLHTTEGEVISIIHPGQHNTHAGPDFTNARIKIGNLTWAGDVEIHVRSSAWDQHQHQHDPAYNNVILHVVYRDDKPAKKDNGQQMPTLELTKHIDLQLINTYKKLMAAKAWIPCQDQLHKVPPVIWHNWKERMTIERMQNRFQALEVLFNQAKASWEEAFYQQLMRHLGLQVNSHPFEQLARTLPLTILLKHRDQLLQLSALLYGQAGMLAQVFTDSYPIALQKEYAYLRKKYNLTPLPAGSWKWLRLRPANFPTIRIAQMAMLLHQKQHLFSSILGATHIKELQTLFSVATDTYWHTHYRFDTHSKHRVKRMGTLAVNNLLINCVIPFVFFYGKYKQKPLLEEKALGWLSSLPAEQNQIIKRWKSLDTSSKHAGDSQGLLHLKKQYCDKARCLQCSIGVQLLQKGSST